MAKRPKSIQAFSDSWLDAVTARLANNRRVRRTLPGRGRLHVDRQLPFLCVYRRPGNRDDPGTQEFVRSEASYLVTSGDRHRRRDVRRLIDGIVVTLTREFGAFLIIEFWSGPDAVPGVDHRVPDESPRFRILASGNTVLSRTVDTLAGRLRKIKILKQTVEVDVERIARVAPPDMAALMSHDRAAELGCQIIGIEIPPVWRNPQTEQDYPLLLRTLRRRLSHALHRGVYEFVATKTTHRPPHFHSLGEEPSSRRSGRSIAS